MKRETLIAESVGFPGVRLLETGAIAVYTGKCTGRSPDAKFIVDDSITHEEIDWEQNSSCTPDEWDDLLNSALGFEKENKIYDQRLYAGRDEACQVGVNVKTSTPWHALFANNMFVRERQDAHAPSVCWTLRAYPQLQEEPKVFINFSSKSIIITGTHYAGEIKKSIFTVLNFVLPPMDILPMHCSVNAKKDGSNAAVFFGLSGTGKTTLSADKARMLIGDDEHGWSPTRLFNFEGGCYAKMINLCSTAEPEIWNAVQMSGATLENVVINDRGIPDFDNGKYTENTRGSYPVHHISNASPTGICDPPENVVFLTCDAFGVLPPVSKLSAQEAIDHFLMGYTAKVAGTEEGVTEPVATFSHCFGGPFMPRKPQEYALLLRRRIDECGATCWLVNTGWSGGKYGVGSRMPIQVSRSIINLILSGELKKSEFRTHTYTGLSIPTATSDPVLNSYVTPEESWESLKQYRKECDSLMSMWEKELKKYDH